MENNKITKSSPLRPYFEQHKCNICQKSAKFGRFAKNKLSYICEDKKCNNVSDVVSGWFNLNLTLPKK
jgi:hypothetical protein